MTGLVLDKTTRCDKTSQPHHDSRLPAKTGAKYNTGAASRERLWEDPDFRPVASSIYYKNPPDVWPDIVWKRPPVRET